MAEGMGWRAEIEKTILDGAVRSTFNSKKEAPASPARSASPPPARKEVGNIEEVPQGRHD
jgi:hypothetical protein